jgi:hypothetical protein
MEIDEEASTNACQAKIRDELGFVDRQHAFDGFHLDDQGILDDEIHSVAAFEANSLVCERDGLLLSEDQSA